MTWPIELGIENGPSRGRSNITPINWGKEEQGGGEPVTYNQLSWY